MRRILLIALGAAILCLASLSVGLYVKHNGQGDAPMPEKKVSEAARKILEENPYYLCADEKLQVSLNVPADRPKLMQIVAQLREATGLDIVVDENLQGHDPAYGYIQPSKQGYHAWQIMEMIAKKDLEDGYWEKTEGGYRLAGTPVVAASSSLSTNSTQTRPAASRRSRQRRVILSATSLVLLVILAILRMRTAKGQTIERAEQTEPQP